MLSVWFFLVTGWASLASRMWYHRSYSNCMNSSCFFLQLDPQVFLSLSEEQRFQDLKSRCAEIELLCSFCQFALLLYLNVSHPLGSQWLLSWRQVMHPVTGDAQQDTSSGTVESQSWRVTSSAEVWLKSDRQSATAQLFCVISALPSE